MRERAQASVETIALVVAALALAAALLLGVVRLAPTLASALGQALSGVFAPGQPSAPGLDQLERLLLDGATGTDADGPTLLDLRTHLRLRLGRPEADAAFAAIIRPLVVRALAAHSIETNAGDIAIVERTTEDGWLHDRFHPALLRRLAEVSAELAGTPGAVLTLAKDAGLGADEPVDAIEPGRAAGDVVVMIGGGFRHIVLRRRPESGLTVIADEVSVRKAGGIR
jgi:hypothetical protein